MKQIIGKYSIYEDLQNFKIRYRYSFSDFTGSILFLLSLAMGTLLLFVFIKTYNSQKVDWIFLLTGLGLTGFGSYFLLAGFYNPVDGVFQINKISNEVIIRDFLSKEIIKSNSISSVFYEISTSTKPRTAFATLMLRLRDGTIINCFIIRTSHPIDIGKEVEKDLHIVSRQIRDKISKALK